MEDGLVHDTSPWNELLLPVFTFLLQILVGHFSWEIQSTTFFIQSITILWGTPDFGLRHIRLQDDWWVGEKMKLKKNLLKITIGIIAIFKTLKTCLVLQNLWRHQTSRIKCFLLPMDVVYQWLALAYYLDHMGNTSHLWKACTNRNVMYRNIQREGR